MYFDDLSQYQYMQKPLELSDHPILCVGWLDANKQFSKGNVSEEFLDRIWVFCCHPVLYTLGFHQCPFCKEPSFGIHVRRGDKETDLGSAEIWILGQNGIIYAAPDLIYHYIVGHDYQPPDEFIQAVIQSPLPGSEDYERITHQPGWPR